MNKSPPLHRVWGGALQQAIRCAIIPTLQPWWCTYHTAYTCNSFLISIQWYLSIVTSMVSPSVSFNSLACQNFGIDFSKIIELSRSPHQQAVTTRSIKIESYITAKTNGLRYDLKVFGCGNTTTQNVPVWWWYRCGGVWWCQVVSLYFVEGLVNFIDLGKEHSQCMLHVYQV